VDERFRSSIAVVRCGTYPNKVLKFLEAVGTSLAPAAISRATHRRVNLVVYLPRTETVAALCSKTDRQASLRSAFLCLRQPSTRVASGM
jgi:hypothetical protein